MNIMKRGATLFLTLALIIGLVGCNMGGNGRYKIAAKLEDQSFCLGFRLDDLVGDAVMAALEVLAANGELRKISLEWFGKDFTQLKGDIDALENLDFEPERRTLLVGYDNGRLPFSGDDKNGVPTGFDPDTARAACELLGWKIRFIPIDVAQAAVELGSGNVDCVWGGFAYIEGETDIRQSQTYMKNTIIVASLAGSKVGSLRSLKGKTLTLSSNTYHKQMLETHSELSERPEFIVEIPGGSPECFEALNKGSCDAIITDQASIDYYLRG